MNITRENVDALNAVVKVDIAKEDYSDKVEKILSDYRKTANIPGFRKGHVPMGMVKKQYGKAVLVDEVNKLLQDALNKYLTEEKLDVLGQPLPKPQDDIDWDADKFSFEFELGLTPEFDVQLKSKKAITHYNIVADDKMINEQIERIQKQYGKITSQKTIEKDSEITGTFKNEERDINNTVTLTLDKFKGKTTEKKFIGAKAGDIITLKTKGLYTDEHELMHALKLTHDDVHGLDIEVAFEITEINKRDLADLDQELFDKLFGEGNVKSATELKEKIKEDFPFDFKYAPSAEDILDTMIPEVYANSIYTAVLDAIASEHGMRMVAMDNASSNCNDVIKKLTLKMNKLRQAAITTELIEVVSGAESLNG